ncbi:GNAT family N-acetyltransferase [Nocardioides sp. Soil774]|uniref:GNAT family N-acetyltransferase n=1 Tax=Nocardioides sp. Soil774 TaxID=1736408 RepID=UPI0009EA7325|nr:GNAT family N-acetyltransferase [Nocardioides sp. Soil774]
MAEERGHHPSDPRVGSHGLGPHVVGQRVVVRHLLPDGRATDVLGTCTSWGADSLTIERDGPPDRAGPVVVALADVVTGKPVPPRASVRARVSAREVELHSFADWAEVAREPLGEWVVRSSPPIGGRLLKRGNSALAMGDPGVPLAEASAHVRAAYARLERVALAQVERDGEVERGLRALGWEPFGTGDSETMLAPLAQVVRRLPPPPDDVEADESPTRVTVRLPHGAGGGEASLDGDWLCLHSLHVRPEDRRRGLATGVVAELLDWGAARGARTAWLHVEGDNTAARALYDRLGFRTHHLNRYLVAR